VTNIPRKTLTQSVVPSLHMRGMPSFFADGLMRLLIEHPCIYFPKITVAMATTVRCRNQLPELATGCRTSVTNNSSNNLSRSAT
jgi:hypothetical protein